MGIERYMAEWLRVMEKFNSAKRKKTNEERVYINMSSVVAGVATFFGLDIYVDDKGHYVLLKDLKALPIWDELKEWV